MSSWCLRFRDNKEIKQSVKYMKKYQDNDYTLVINRARLDDRGEYTVRAKNSYGTREEVVFLNVQSTKCNEKSINLLNLNVILCCRGWNSGNIVAQTWGAGQKTRTAQNIDVRGDRDQSQVLVPSSTSAHPGQPFLQADLLHHWQPDTDGNGWRFLVKKLKFQYFSSQVTWTKDGRPMSEDRINIDCRHGVCSIEIFNVRLEDAGRYTCTAENKLGLVETSCVLSVQSTPVVVMYLSKERAIYRIEQSYRVFKWNTRFYLKMCETHLGDFKKQLFLHKTLFQVVAVAKSSLPKRGDSIRRPTRAPQDPASQGLRMAAASCWLKTSRHWCTRPRPASSAARRWSRSSANTGKRAADWRSTIRKRVSITKINIMNFFKTSLHKFVGVQ